MSDYTIPLLRTIRAFTRIQSGTCGIRWKNTPYDPVGTLVYNVGQQVTAVVTNEGLNPISLTFKIAKTHNVSENRTDVSSPINLVAHGESSLDFAVPTDAKYLEVWSSNGTSDVRVTITSKLSLSLCGFNRVDSTASSDWKMPDTTTLSVGVPIDAVVPVQAGVPMVWSLPKDAFIWSGTALPTISFSGVTTPLFVSGTTISGTFPVTAQSLGDHVITVTLSLGNLTASQSFNLRVYYVNKAPVVVQDPSALTCYSGQETLYTIPFSDIFYDDPIDTLTYSVSGLPEWLSYSNGVLSGIPSNDYIGLDESIILTATDSSSLSVSAHLGVVVINNPPVFSSAIPDITVTAGTKVSYHIPDGLIVDSDTLILSAAPLPGWLTFNPALRTFTGTPSESNIGSTVVTLTATDTLDQSASTTFTVTVNE